MYVDHRIAHHWRPSAHRVSLTLDRPGACYGAGETITGSLVVLPGEFEPAPAPTIELQYVACGRLMEVAALVSEALPQAEWGAGQQHTFTFSLPVPCLPTPFSSERVRSYVRVAARRP